MTLTMHDSQLNTLDEINKFINSSDRLIFKSSDRKEAYEWIEKTLFRFGYTIDLNKKEKGIVKRYIQKVTGYSRAQVTRLVSQYVSCGRVVVKEHTQHTFKKKYTNEDIKLLAKTDDLHEYPNGNTLKKIFERMYKLYNQDKYKVLCAISVAHIYNLRSSSIYKRIAKNYERTKPSVVNIGERKKPNPQGKPGYLRVDTVHQGDQDGEKGVYHVNMIDEVTQFQFVGATQKISYAYLVPILEKLINTYPFVICEFHSDNGSEYINKQVVKLLNKLLIKLTKSRARKTNDNALVESKNNVIRKWLGYGFIQQKHSDELNVFYTHFNEYLNYHKPCAFATKIENKKGKIKKIYRLEDYVTPYDKFINIHDFTKYLKPNVTPKQLNKIAIRYTDNEMAEIVQKKRTKLFKEVYQPIAFIRSGSSWD